MAHQFCSKREREALIIHVKRGEKIQTPYEEVTFSIYWIYVKKQYIIYMSI